MIHSQRIAMCLFAAALAAPAASAQFNNQWATFVRDNNRIKNPDGTTATQVTNDTDEKDYAVGDVNRDGWPDLVVMRKQPAATTGKRVNQLLMNENGVLVDRTAQYCQDTDVPGDLGFNTPTNDRDATIIDLDGDQWPDIITATTLSDGDPKHISHPRVYRNKGAINGVWQGFRFENSRFPQLLTIPGNLAVAPRFCAVAVGDVNADGSPDLYFADYDSTETFISEPLSWDLNDRLLMNDGNGFFTDSLQTRMTSTMLQSAFGFAAEIIDMNGDAVLDVVKGTALGTPQRVSVAYNDPLNIGIFGQFQTTVNQSAPYHFDAGDLNQDGRPDVIVSDDGQDSYRYNTGNDALGRVVWGSLKTYQFLTGADDGFAGNCYIVDLNNDGWPDTLHCDFDVDVAGCGARLHIYHNPGGNPGDQITLKEEAQQASGGWRGVVGMLAGDQSGTYDVAVFDLDGDNDKDMVVGRCSGTFVWINQLNQPGAITQYCFGDGTATACPCGNNSAVGDREGCLNSLGMGGKLTASGNANITGDTLVLHGSRMPNSSALYFQGTTQAGAGLGTVFGDGLRCAAGSVIRLGTKINASNESIYPQGGDLSISVKGAVPAGATRTYQIWYRNAAAFCNPETFNLSNGTQVIWAP
jgi:hypothetical protein